MYESCLIHCTQSRSADVVLQKILTLPPLGTVDSLFSPVFDAPLGQSQGPGQSSPPSLTIFIFY